MESGRSTTLKLFLAGDVMTGRGIDQVLGQPSSPELFESCVQDAREYVSLAEEKNGPIPRPVPDDGVWGDALAVLDGFAPDIRLINLETSITTCDSHWPGKGIHYRMHPANIGCLSVARLDVCTLANNHVLDWGHQGLYQTLEVLAAAGIAAPGAGHDSLEARRPAVIQLGAGKRLLISAVGMTSSGIPRTWAAAEGRGGVFLLDGAVSAAVTQVREALAPVRQPGDRVLVSVHWGGNWGYDVTPDQQLLARQLIDLAGVDLVHGHSSHHPQGVEVYRDRLILYGCGDLINDYEGIRGYEAYRPELSLMYLVELEPDSGSLRRLTMVPMLMAGFRLHRAQGEQTRWLAERLGGVYREFGSGCRITGAGELELVVGTR